MFSLADWAAGVSSAVILFLLLLALSYFVLAVLSRCPSVSLDWLQVLPPYLAPDHAHPFLPILNIIHMLS